MAKHSIPRLDSWSGITVACGFAVGFVVNYVSADAQLNSHEVFPESREVQVFPESREVAPHGIDFVLSRSWQKTGIAS